MTKLRNMFNRLLIGFGLLLFVLLGFTIWEYFNKDSSEFVQTLNSQEATDQTGKMVPLFNPKQNLKEETFFPEQSEREFDLSMLMESPILEDLTLGFATTQDMQAFLKEAKANGCVVKDRSAELKTVRLRVSDLDKASRYFDKTDKGEEPH